MSSMEKSRSKRLKCKICGEKIENTHRVLSMHWLGIYYHIECLKEFANKMKGE